MSRGLYSVAQVRELEARAIAAGTPGYTLMQRAAARCWQEMQQRWPQAQRIHIVCGSGNNGGDGYVIARLAREAGCIVRLSQVGPAPARGDGLRAAQDWQRAGGSVQAFDAAALAQADLVVDALLGIGLTRLLEGETLAAVQAINASGAPVLAVDLPSGLDGDRGRVWGAAVQACVTVSFIAAKTGLFTGAAADHVGTLVLDDLGVAYDCTPVAACLQQARLHAWLPRRARTAHKGQHGHVLVVGGDHGMMGAALLAGRAALRGGADWVSLATRHEHAAALTAAQAELMVRGVEQARELSPLLERADVIAIGPGLGQAGWGRALFAAVLECRKPCIADADALNLLAQEPARRQDWVLTPHPSEAARLLGCRTADIQNDRYQAVRGLQERFGGTAVLKGAGSLIQGQQLALCPYGNPGMGVGGMGDVLTGLIAALAAQGLPLERAAQAGVLAHALAGDRAAQGGERGLLPSDVFDHLRGVLNP